MNRSIQTVFVILLLTTAALVAGCSSRTSDVIVGTWQSDNFESSRMAFYDNGSCAILYESGGAYYEDFDGKWKALNNSEYVMYVNTTNDILEFKYMYGKLYEVQNVNNAFTKVSR